MRGGPASAGPPTTGGIVMRIGIVFAALVAAMAATPAADAAEIAAGEKIYKKVCRACHGPTAKGMASFPKLAGRDSDYIAGRLEQYRSGEKIGPNTALMAPHAAKLSDDDIANLASFIDTKFK